MERDEGMELVVLGTELVLDDVLGERKATDHLFQSRLVDQSKGDKVRIS